MKRILDEIKATWNGGSKFARLIMVAFAVWAPYDVIRGNWFDAAVAVLVLFWVWQSVKENNT